MARGVQGSPQADIYGKNPSQRASERAKDSVETTVKYSCMRPLLALKAHLKQAVYEGKTALHLYPAAALREKVPGKVSLNNGPTVDWQDKE